MFSDYGEGPILVWSNSSNWALLYIKKRLPFSFSRSHYAATVGILSDSKTWRLIKLSLFAHTKALSTKSLTWPPLMRTARLAWAGPRSLGCQGDCWRTRTSYCPFSQCAPLTWKQTTYCMFEFCACTLVCQEKEKSYFLENWYILRDLRTEGTDVTYQIQCGSFYHWPLTALDAQRLVNCRWCNVVNRDNNPHEYASG